MHKPHSLSMNHQPEIEKKRRFKAFTRMGCRETLEIRKTSKIIKLSQKIRILKTIERRKRRKKSRVYLEMGSMTQRQAPKINRMLHQHDIDNYRPQAI